MAKLTLQEIFGQNATFEGIDETEFAAIVSFHLDDFKDSANGGQINDGIGFDDVATFNASNINSKAEAIFIALVQLIIQNQATNLNDDPEQKIFISDGGKTFGTGARNGQIRRAITVNLFSDLNINSLPDLDDV